MQIAEAYYLVLDLEATCAEDKSIPRPQRETIEIGAVMLNAESLQVEGEWQRFVQPVVRPQLTPYCTQLTSITQTDVEGAAGFTTVMADLCAWAETFGSYRLCAWGDYDRRQLQRDCQRHGIDYPFGDGYLNLKQAFSASQGVRQMGLMAALAQMELRFEGRCHRGIDDARNTARLIARLRML